jgi:hypothetical protein
VRTTIRIDDDLYREVKAMAARSGRTVAAVLEDAVRRGLHVDGASATTPYALTPLGRAGVRPGVDLSSGAAIAEILDDDVPIDALR